MHVMTKKYLKLYILAGLSLLSLVGCQKDGQGVTLKAKISPVANGADKLYIDGFSTYWTSGDSVFVNDQSGCAVSINNDGSAIIQGVTSSSSYAAVYPSSIVTSASVSAGSQVNITLPATQVYSQVDGNQIVSVPMAAYTTGTTLDFANLCSVVKVEVTNSTGAAFSLNSITITAEGARLAGAGVLTINQDGSSSITMSEGPTSSVSLSFGTSPYELSANASKSFYLVLPAFDQTGIDIVLSTTSGEYSYQKTNSLPANMIAKLALTVDAAQEPPMSGEFTVADGKQVKFALGNLQYSSTGTHATADGNNTTGTWRFAEHQYDQSATGLTSTFKWGTSGYHGIYPNPPNGVNWDPGMDENCDWGKYNAISNGGNTVGYWRTLTSAEWQYVLYSRTTDFYYGTNRWADRRYIKCIVGSTCGLLLFPDSFTWPSSVSLPSYTTAYYFFRDYINGNQKSFTSLSLTVDQFQLFEDEGCVFLPTPSGGTGYWTASRGDDDSQRRLVFIMTSKIDNFSYSFSNEYYVRLVRPIN